MADDLSSEKEKAPMESMCACGGELAGTKTYKETLANEDGRPFVRITEHEIAQCHDHFHREGTIDIPRSAPPSDGLQMNDEGLSGKGYDPLLLSALDDLLSAEGDAPNLEDAPQQAIVLKPLNADTDAPSLVYRGSSMPLLRNLLIQIDRAADEWRNRRHSGSLR